MDILTEIYRIKQVMGLITEQSSGNLVTDDVYDAIKNIESVFSLTDKDGNIIPRPELNGKEKEQNIKKAIGDTIGLDYWKKMSPKLQGQIYSFMYQADSSENSLYRWLAGLVSAIIPDEDTPTPPVNRSDIYTNKVAILDKNGNDTGKKRILPLSELSLEKQKNIESAIKKVQDAIVNNKINYLNYMNIVKNQYETLGGTTNDAQNRIKIWAPRPEALDRLMNNESWPNVKAWWYKKIGETDPTNQVNNASTQKDSTPANPNVAQPPVIQKQDSALANTNVAQPPVIQKQDSALANTAQPNTSASAITNSQATPVQRSAEELKLDTFKDGEYGDPYVYIQNTSGDFLTFKCGKRNENCPGLINKDYNSVIWINVTKGRKEGKTDYSIYENGIRVGIYGLEALPTGAEETTSTPEIIRRNVLNKFRNLFYSTYLSVIASKNLADVKKWPIKPTYKGQLDIFGDTYDVNLVGVVSSTPPKITVGAQLFTKIMDNFITKKVDVGGVKYELKAYNADAISPALNIFEKDSIGYVGDDIAKNQINSKNLGIYKVE